MILDFILVGSLLVSVLLEKKTSSVLHSFLKVNFLRGICICICPKLTLLSQLNENYFLYYAIHFLDIFSKSSSGNDDGADGHFVKKLKKNEETSRPALLNYSTLVKFFVI